MRKLFVFLALFSVAASTQHCGGGSSSSSPGATTYLGTSSPGDVWNFTINRQAGTFSANTDGGVAGTTAWSMSGTLQSLNFGFLELTVTATQNGAQTAPTITQDGTHNVAYAMEVPAVMLLVQPPGGGTSSSSHMITAVYNIGTCTNTQGTSVLGGAWNFLQVGFSGNNYNAAANTAFGYVHFSGGASQVTIDGENDYALSLSSVGAFTQQANPLQTFFKTSHSPSSPGATLNCSNGTVTGTSGGSTFTGTVAGTNQVNSIESAMILDMGQGNGGILGFPGIQAPASNVFAGMTFDGLAFNNNTSNSTQPVQVTMDGSGTHVTVSQIGGNPSNLTVGSPVAFLKINGFTNTGLVDLSSCTDNTFSSCTNSPAGGMVNQPSGANQKWVIALNYLSSGTSPGTLIVVQQ